MNTRRPPRELAMDLCIRSPYPVQMAAVLSDRSGRIFRWGWNHPSQRNAGFSVHAEQHAFQKANRERLRGALLTVAGRRRKSGNWVFSRPCEEKCLRLAEKYGIRAIEYITPSGAWLVEQAPFVEKQKTRAEVDDES